MAGVYEQAKNVFSEVMEKSRPEIGNLFVIGCSTSTVQGDKPGTNSSEEVAGELYRAACETIGDKYDIAVQCCEHLNRALVLEKEVALKYGFPIVNAVPHRKAGGAFATKHYNSLKSPVVVEDIASSAVIGIDIGRLEQAFIFHAKYCRTADPAGPCQCCYRKCAFRLVYASVSVPVAVHIYLRIKRVHIWTCL